MNDLNRHLVRKFLQADDLPHEVLEVISKATVRAMTKKQKKEKKQSALITPKGEYIKSFIYNTLPIPTVYPVPVYFEMALRQVEYLKQQKPQVINEARSNESLDKMLSNLYFFFGTSSIFVSQLTTSIECLINTRILAKTNYKRQKDGKEIIGNENLWISLKEKVEFLIKELTNLREFEILHPKDLEIIKSLIDFRNKCVHPKKDEIYAMDNFEDLLSSSLSFNYENALKSTMNFINYYSGEKLIEECFCQNLHPGYAECKNTSAGSRKKSLSLFAIFKVISRFPESIAET
jgi:hypothetical protein